MPDYGTARADFPGGDSRQLFRSIRRLMELPEHTRLFLCHDHKAVGRDRFAWETMVGAQKTGNVHLYRSVSEDDFVAMRDAHDATLGMRRRMAGWARARSHFALSGAGFLVQRIWVATAIRGVVLFLELWIIAYIRA